MIKIEIFTNKIDEKDKMDDVFYNYDYGTYNIFYHNHEKAKKYNIQKYPTVIFNENKDKVLVNKEINKNNVLKIMRGLI